MTRWQTGTSALRLRTGLGRVVNAYGVFSIAEFAIWLAILVAAYKLGGARLAGLVALIQYIPAIILVPFVGTLGDRMSRGTALVIAYSALAVGCAVTSILLATGVPFAWVVVGAVCCTTAVGLVRPMHFSALPQLAKSPSELVSANAMSSLMDSVGLIVGPIVAGAMTQWVGPWLVFAASSVACVIAASMCSRLRLPVGRRHPESTGRREAASMLTGLRTIVHSWALLALIVIVGAKFFVEGSLEVLGISYSFAVLDKQGSTAGLLVAAVGVGGLIGAFVGSVVVARPRLAPIVLAGGLITAAGLVTVTWLHGLAIVLTMFSLVGFGVTLLMVSSRTLMQRSTEDAVLSRVFAIQESIALIGLALGAVTAPLLISWTSAATAFLPLGLGMLLLTVGTIGFVRKLDLVATYRPRELALLRRLQFLGPLQPAELEYIANHSHWRDIPAGEPVVTQGEHGTDYFVVEVGEFSVIEDGVLKSHTITNGEGFGEKALLNGEVRTATVTALKPSRLLVIRPQEFLGAFGRTVDDLLPDGDLDNA